MRLQKILTILILAMAAGFAGYLLAPMAQAPNQPAHVSLLHSAVASASGLAVGDTPPNFTLQDINGRSVTLSHLRGHAVWINFWATWCPWCKSEMPDMEKMHQQYGNKILIYGIDFQESRKVVDTYLQQHGIHYDVLLDKTGAVATAYDITGLPESIFIAPDGRITAVHLGALLTIGDMKTLINQTLSRRS